MNLKELLAISLCPTHDELAKALKENVKVDSDPEMKANRMRPNAQSSKLSSTISAKRHQVTPTKVIP